MKELERRSEEGRQHIRGNERGMGGREGRRERSERGKVRVRVSV